MPNDKADPMLSISAFDIKEVLVCVCHHWHLASFIVSEFVKLLLMIVLPITVIFLSGDTGEMISFTLNNMWFVWNVYQLTKCCFILNHNSVEFRPKRNPCASTFLLSTTRPKQKPKFSVNALIFKCCFFNIFCQVYFLYAVPVHSVKHV